MSAYRRLGVLWVINTYVHLLEVRLSLRIGHFTMINHHGKSLVASSSGNVPTNLLAELGLRIRKE